jgi:hypothetical protein
MANFKTHISFGVIIGITLAILVTYFSFTKSLLVAFIAFFCVLIGSFLPDIDVDTGTPFQIIFGLFSLLGSSIIAYYLVDNHVSELKYLVGLPIITFIFIRIVVGNIFKKFTAHRGIWHSIPALLISVLATLQLVNRFDLSIMDKMIISISIGLGYLNHLILDEVYSMVNIGGVPFKVKRSLGSALELVSKSKIATIIAYIMLLILLFLSYPIIIELINGY